METRANYALIGAFTLAVILAGFGFTLWIAGGPAAMREPQPNPLAATGG